MDKRERNIVMIDNETPVLNTVDFLSGLFDELSFFYNNNMIKN